MANLAIYQRVEAIPNGKAMLALSARRRRPWRQDRDTSKGRSTSVQLRPNGRQALGTLDATTFEDAKRERDRKEKGRSLVGEQRRTHSDLRRGIKFLDQETPQEV